MGAGKMRLGGDEAGKQAGRKAGRAAAMVVVVQVR
ncbi:hypothetical protein E2C01_050028 [Portunus trituberculatus]|uniref:Uncharacterized protein n=1 Tax=Portunus trituberculatus TaxID=210409 RepID=A0A5B7GFJ9_PORTR|nr:hypothetical protein [Portunus trituberculatus]